MLCFIASRFQVQEGRDNWVTQEMFERIIGGIIKQGVEKLEPLREEAGRVLGMMRTRKAGDVWEWSGKECLVVDQL